MSPQVVFRVDAGPAIGTGHLVRCLVLAEELRERDADVVFATGPVPDALQKRIAEVARTHHIVHQGIGGPPAAPERQQVEDAGAMLSVLSRNPEMVVVDHYGLSAPWQRALTGRVDRVIVIDDLADREHDCDVLLDQNWSGPDTAHRYDDLLPPRCRRLIGPRYALLHARYRSARTGRRAPTSPPQRALVSFGGSDPTNETLKFLRSLRGSAHPQTIDLVIGAASDHARAIQELAQDLPSVTVHRDLPFLADLLASADVAIGAGGTTTWERICLEVPSIVTTVADNQREVVAALDAAGAITWLGDASETTPDLYADQWHRAAAGDVPAPPPLVDGYGAPRVALCLLPPPASELRLRAATRGDAPTFIGSDPGARSILPSYLTGAEVWRQQTRRFRTMLEDPESLALVAEIDGVPVGGAWLGGPDERPVSWIDDALAGSAYLSALDTELQRWSVGLRSSPS